MIKAIARFFGSKRRLIELQFDIGSAMQKPTADERHEAMGKVIQKHNPERWARIQRELAEAAAGFLVTDGKTVQFNPIRREHAAVPVRKL